MHTSILINEFLPDPVGADRGWEWVEIVNISNEEIDISNWEIQVAGVRYNRAFKFPVDSKILPKQYLLICEEFVDSCDYYTTQLAIQNGGKETDGIRILNNTGEIIDTVLYDTTNSNNLLNDFGDIEKDENIVEMPPEACSLSRSNYSDTNYSILDFFVTCNTTPGAKNLFESNIIISEVGINFIEFYSSNIPHNLEKWYLKESQKSLQKVFLKNNFKNNFFFLEITKPLQEIYLYSPDDILIDSFVTEKLSPNYTLCRLNSNSEELFTFCKETKGEINEKKEWKAIGLLEIIQMNKKNFYIINPCVMYRSGDMYIISDETAAIATKCNECKIDDCFLGELYDGVEVLEKTNLKKIDIEVLNKKNYLQLFNKIIFLKGEFSKSDNQYSFFKTEAGLVKTPKGEYSKNTEYTLKGILSKDEKMILNLEHVVLVSKAGKENVQTLEQTGDPLIVLIFFLIIPFLLSKIFVKLTTIKLNHF